MRAVEPSLAIPRKPLSCRLKGRKEEKGRGRGGWDAFLDAVEVTQTAPLLLWPLVQLGERGLSYRLTNEH